MNSNEEQWEAVRQLRKDALLDLVNTSIIFFQDHHVSTSGKRMSWDEMPYLKEIYLDTCGDIVIMSSTQTGKTEWALLRGYACMDMGLNVFHIFSTGEAKNSFVKSRIDDLCDQVPMYQNMEKDDRRNRYLRHMGNANWKFVISNSRANFDEFPADVIIIDEIDSCNVENIQLADSRTENSSYKFKFRLGNPTVTNTGIADLYEFSDKKKWFFQCAHCGEYFNSEFMKCVVWEVLDKDNNHVSYNLYDEDWNEDLDRDVKVRCSECKELQYRPADGRWKMTTRRSKRSGYHISKMMKLNAPVHELWNGLIEAEGNDYRLQVFYNKVLGLPFEGAGSKVTNAMLAGLTHNYFAKESCSKKHHTIAGMDVGDKYDLEICLDAKKEGKRTRILLNAFRCSSLDEVKDKIEEFNIKTMCVDIKPERNFMKEFRESMFGICNVILIDEVEGRSGMLKIRGFDEKEDEGVIVVDRTWLLDESMAKIRHKELILPKNYDSILGGYWVKSMESITRILLNEKNEYKWSKSRYDHMRFADAFCMMAWMKNQEAVIMGDDCNSVAPDENARQEYRDDSIGLIKRRYQLGNRRERRSWRNRG